MNWTSGWRSRQCQRLLTFVLKEVTHPCPPGKDKLRNILHNFGLVLGRQRSEPFRQALAELELVWERAAGCAIETNHFALAREKDKVAAGFQSAAAREEMGSAGFSYVMAMMKAFLQ